MIDGQTEIEQLLARVQARDRQRAEFIGTVSHDLKTPLNAIIGFTSVLLADPTSFEPEQTRQLRLVYESARTLLGRINDLLEFHRLEAGKVQPESTWLFPAEIVVQAVEEHRKQAKEQGVDIQLQIEGGPPRIRSDARLLRGIMDELLSNAIRYGGQGAVVVTIAPVEADDSGRRRVRISVSDPGAVLPDEKKQELAQALDPSAGELKRSYKGLGLGLALARETARELGGWLAFEQPAKGGIRFWLVLNLPAAYVEA